MVHFHNICAHHLFLGFTMNMWFLLRFRSSYMKISIKLHIRAPPIWLRQGQCRLLEIQETEKRYSSTVRIKLLVKYMLNNQ